MNKIIIVTTTRADFGLLHRLVERLGHEPGIDARLLATGTHLSADHGNTVDEITAAGFEVAIPLPMELESDHRGALTRSSAGLMDRISAVLEDQQPDAIILLGDRFEILPIAYAAVMLGVRIIHLHGGEITLGAIDNKIRNAVSSLADLHLAATRQAADRLIAAGAGQDQVAWVGAPGVENAISLNPASMDDIIATTGFTFCQRNILFTFHPETVSSISTHDQIDQTLSALSRFPGVGKFLSMPNADPGNQMIRQRLAAFRDTNPNTWLWESLGHHLYLSMMKAVDAVVGNSSSGIIEAPAFGTMTVNIGDRQKGREQAGSVITCRLDANEIEAAIAKALSGMAKPDLDNHPYYRADTTERMMAAIRAMLA